MRRNPATVAWIVLLLSFCGCVFVAYSVPRAASWYVNGATQPREAELEVIGGTALLQQVGDRAEVGVSTRQKLQEGDAVRTTNDSHAIVWLFDNSNVHLWPNSRVVLPTLRLSQFNNSLTSISLTLEEGHCRVEVAPPSTSSRRLEIVTPTAHILLREGSYSIEVTTVDGTPTTHVVTRNGSASVTAYGKTVEVLRSERTEVAADQAPTPAEPAARNLIVNGDFSQGLHVGWVADTRAEDNVLPLVTTDVQDGLHLVRFLRAGSTKHGEAILIQQLNQDVTDFDTLQLNLELKIVAQSLSGGGWMGSEYPVMVRLRYRDIHGTDNIWVRGFYVQNKDNLPTSNGMLIPEGSWYRLSAPLNLFDPATISPRPAAILAIELVASGWDFDSAITDVRLIAE